MSKVDAQRAMREARYAAFQARRATTSSSPAGAKPASVRPPTAARQQDTDAVPDAADAVSGDPAPAAPQVGPHAHDTPASTPGEPTSPAPSATTETQAGLCGYRNIGGKVCSRPAGHPEKNHRYK